MNKINWSKEVESTDIEMSLFVEFLTRTDSKLPAVQL